MQKNNALMHRVHYELLCLYEVIVLPSQFGDKVVFLDAELVVNNVYSKGAEKNVRVNLDSYGLLPG